MRIESEHASVYADVVVADHNRRVVLASLAAPKTAVRGIYAALQSQNKPPLRVFEDDGADPVAVVRGATRYRSWGAILPSVKGVQMIVLANDDRAPVGYAYVPDGWDEAEQVAKALEDDPQLVVPVLDGWGAYFLARGQEALADFREGTRGVPGRLVEPLRVFGNHISAAYLLARDLDSWVGIADEGLKEGEITLGEGGG